MLVQISLPIPVFDSFGFIPRSGIVGSHGTFMFNFLRHVCLLLTADLSHACVPEATREATSELSPEWPLGLGSGRTLAILGRRVLVTRTPGD